MDLLVKNGALVFKAGDIVLTRTRREAVRQRLILALGVHRGEWFLDVTAGIPYRADIMVRPYDPQIVQAILTERILADEDVAALESFTLDLDPTTRRLTFSFVAALTPEPDGLQGQRVSTPTPFDESSLIDSGEIELSLVVSSIGAYL